MSARPRSVVLAHLLWIGACKFEPVGDIDPHPESRRQEAWYSHLADAHVVDEEESLVEAELRSQLALLTNPALEGRRPGSDGAALTASHLERSMRDVGLSPAGVGGGWRQPVVVRIRETEEARLELPSVDATAEPHVLRQGDDVVLWRSDVAGLWKESLPVIDAGYGISAPELGHDDYAGVVVKDAIVLVRAGFPEEGSFDEAAVTLHASLEAKLARAHAAGAVGCLVATGALRTEPTWTATVAEHLRAHLDTSEGVDIASLPTPFVGLLSAEAEAEVRAWMAAVGETENGVANLTAVVTTTERTILDPNIVGRISGSTRPEEVVVVLAHWDAGGSGPVLAEGGGAIDNATGVAALLATARKSADWVRRGRMPDRSIAFVATASDTLDLAGTRALLLAGPLRRSDVVAVVALDSLSVHPGGPSLGVLGGKASSLADEIRGYRPSLRAIESHEGGTVNPSHTAVLHNGIPAVTLTRHDHEADAEDTFNPGGPVDDLRDDVALLFDVVWSYAESTKRPSLAEAEPAP